MFCPQTIEQNLNKKNTDVRTDRPIKILNYTITLLILFNYILYK